ncbi:MAG: extracellular solute-binding protein [Oscillospiraceae bacterium]|nr:extracellular solute-binding protein [Oscillospiraceae bacterium]
MQIKRILSFALVFALIFSFSGCMNRDEENPNSTPDVVPEDELVIYHNNTDLAPMLMALTEEYSSATGNKISAKLAGSDFLGEMKSQSAVIYVVDTHSDLSDWHSGGLFSDIMNDSGLSGVSSGIPAGLQFNMAGLGSYGVPLMLEGYGYIFDRDMLSDLFGSENVQALANDLRTCSFTEFEGFVAAVDTYIQAPSAATVTLNGNSYTFAAEKTGRAANLTGVFSLNSESTRAMEHLLSYGLAAKFGSRYEVMSADEAAVSGMEDVVSAYMEVLDLHTSHIAGAEGSIGRGDEFTGGDYNYSTSIDLFTRGYALFYPGGTSDAADFEESDAAFGENLDIIPMKLPLSDDDITASGMTAEKLQSSIVIGSRYYIAINPSADENLAAAARDFINWIYTDEAGRNAYSSAFGGVPHNFEYITEENPVGGENGVVNDGSGSGTDNSDTAGGFGSDTESGTVSPENATPSGTGESDQAGIENENSGISSDENGSSAGGNSESATDGSAQGNDSANGSTGTEITPESGNTAVPSHTIEDSLLSAVADYYAKGNWIPDMSKALPVGFVEDILDKSLSDYWGMETWAEEDRTSFIDTILGGWKERLDKNNTAVG